MHIPKLTLLLLSCTCFQLPAQLRQRKTNEPHSIEHSVARIKQIGQFYSNKLHSLNEKIAHSSIAEQDLLNNPFYFSLFSGNTLYSFPLKSEMGTIADTIGNTDIDTLIHNINRNLLHSYTAAPQHITQQLLVSEKPNLSSTTTNTALKPDIPLLSSGTSTTDMPEEFIDKQSLHIFVYKPNFWRISSNFSLQFMQYHVSDNWYKGGENHNSLLGTLNIDANYDNKEKLTFTNRLELRLGYQSSSSDSQHRYKTNADQIRLTNKLGLQSSKHWYYTAMLQTWTQFSPGYHANDVNVYSDFLSPLESVLSLGMDYKRSNKNFEISTTLSPFAAKLKYVDRLALSTHYGLEQGKHHDLSFGSTATINFRWNIINDIQWSSRLFYFTNYSRAQIEWENTISLKVNKYLSTKLFLYPRFDDDTSRKEGQSYFQFNEYLSVGLDLSF